MFVCPECGASQSVAGHCAVDGTPLSPAGEDLLLGTTIGAYRVARLLGIGGMGRVYKGVQPAIGSRVAIKVLSRECSDRRDLVDRFFAEAKAVNLIRHEGIVNVLDLAILPDGRPYIIMEYLDGAPLASLIEHGVTTQIALPLGGVARLVAEVLDALGAAHAKAIVHRDLKPDNIFVAPSGRPKVLDFGIAKLSDLSNAATLTGSLLGTPHYMAPEQAAGRPVDHRADLYAIGVILFECTTGHKPFQADALFDLLRMHVEAPPPSPRALRPDMPPELEQVILIALAKAPDQRFSSAAAMSVALHRATAQLPQDQWRALVPPNSPLASAGGWAPPPPASWTGPPGVAGDPTPSPVQPSLGHAATVSAGQVIPRPTPRPGPTPVPPSRPSRKPLWIAIGAAAIIGGGAAALVVRNPDKVPQAAGKADTWGAVPPAAPAVPAQPDDDHDRDDSDGDDQAASAVKQAATATKRAAAAAKRAAKHAGDPLADALDQLDETIEALPPDQQNRLAAFKGLATLPPNERIKRLRELARQSGVGTEGLAPAIAMVEALDEVPATPVPPVPPVPPSGAWITSHEIDPPSGYDPRQLDVSAFIPWAIAQAKRAVPDAQLIRIDTNGVGADGRANLTLPSQASEHGSIDVRFISPSRGQRDPKQPLGVARHDFKCEFRVMATPEGVELMPIDFFDCAKEHVVPVPRCSLARVWAKAIKRKAPSHNAVGNVGYRSNGSAPVWYFAIGAGFDVAFSEMFGDDC